MGKKPLELIRLKCLECSDEIYSEVENCEFIDCALYNFRFGIKMEEERITSNDAIRNYCVIDCMNNQKTEVKKCPAENCIFYKRRITGREK